MIYEYLWVANEALLRAAKDRSPLNATSLETLEVAEERMGHHYIPQQYLRGFSDPHDVGAIWMYDKQLQRFTHPSIRSVVQQTGYYDADTEKQLNEFVEGPANSVLNRLRRGHKIKDDERVHLELYVGTMLMRVPRRRRRALEMLPGVLDQTISEVRTIAEASSNADPELVERRLSEVERVYESLRQKPPTTVLEQIRSPWPSEKVLAAVIHMTWRIVSTDGPTFFLTSDNPAYFFPGYGLGNRESELTFPLASDLALMGSWQGEPRQTIFLEAKPALVKEANRRIASGAERFVFYREQEKWVAKLAQNKNPCLNRIQW